MTELPPGFVVEWHRPAVSQRLFKVWWRPALMIAVGACCLAVAGILGDDPRAYIPLTIVGLPLTIAGPYKGLRGLFKIFTEDDFLEVRSTGLRARLGNDVLFVPWDALDAISPDESGKGIRISLDEGDDWLFPHSFIGFSDDAFCTRLLELRRKGLMGLLRRATKSDRDDNLD